MPAPFRSRPTVRRLLLLGALALTAVLLPAAAANATLQLAPNSPHSGKVGYSADGLGQFGAGGSLQAEVPAGSTVVKAWLHGTSQPSQSAAVVINFDGTNVPLALTPTQTGGFFPSSTARADVTNQVKTKVGTPALPGGIYNFVIGNDPSALDGVSLTVVYTNPTLPDGTVAVLDGGSSNAGDQATFNFLSPISKGPGFAARMSLGSGFSYQGEAGPDHTCGALGSINQFSIVNVNGTRLTSCAGDYDDGQEGNGALITVGGVGDSPDNPTDPNATPQTSNGAMTEDELYDLNPFIDNGDTQLVINTSNPSNDDNLFLAVIAVTAQAAVTTEDCNNGVDDDGDTLVDMADPDCTPPTTEPQGKMVGKGRLLDANDGNVDYAFKIDCNDATVANHPFEARWKNKSFKLGANRQIMCSDNPLIAYDPGFADFDTQEGTGTGTYNGQAGWTLEYKATDEGAGAGNVNDSMRIIIKNPANVTVIDVQGKPPGAVPRLGPADRPEHGDQLTDNRTRWPEGTGSTVASP